MNPHEPRQPPADTPASATPDPAGRQALSGLADGHAEDTAAACQAWREDADARRAWHAYHLIGDVLRSDELARPPAADAAFLHRLRERLAEEPVILAPAPLAAVVVAPLPARRTPRWVVPSAVAAGFMVVAGVLVVTRMTGPELGPVQPQIAQAPPLVTPGASAPPTLTLAGEMIRDRELDAYLDAHQSARGRGALAVPGGMLRSVALPAGAGR